MNEQRVREIVREEMEKKEATAVTIASTIDISSNADVEQIVKKITQGIEKANTKKVALSESARRVDVGQGPYTPLS